MDVSFQASTWHGLEPMKTPPSFIPKSYPVIVKMVPIVPSLGETPEMSAAAAETITSKMQQTNVLFRYNGFFIAILHSFVNAFVSPIAG
jgi:hypothetical protein